MDRVADASIRWLIVGLLTLRLRIDSLPTVGIYADCSRLIRRSFSRAYESAGIRNMHSFNDLLYRYNFSENGLAHGGRLSHRAYSEGAQVPGQSSGCAELDT